MVLEETKRFHQELPRLLRQYRGRWVVFKHGKVHGDHQSESEAYAAALKKFDRNAGFVVAQVTEVTPSPITAAALFGVA